MRVLSSTQVTAFSAVDKFITIEDRILLSQPTVVLNSCSEMLLVRALKVKALITLPKNKNDTGVATPPPVAATAPISMRNQSRTVA